MKFKTPFQFLILACVVLFSSEILTAQTATFNVNQDAKITRLLDLKKSLEKDNKLHEGFTVQLYSGNLNKANSVLKEYRNKYSSWRASIEYETPNYKVWAGDYTTRLEADRAVLDIRRNFPTAFVIKATK